MSTDTKTASANPLVAILGETLLANKKRTVSTEQWSCAACTLLNEAAATSCAVCGTPASAAASSSGPWNCPKCTLENTGSECQACGAANLNVEELKTETALAGKHVALYFSAHWCGPCRQTTPLLCKWYTDFKATEKGQNMETVFVSWDRSEGDFASYFAEMPFLAVPFGKGEALGRKYKVNGIPTLIVLGPDGKVVTSEGRRGFMTEPTNFPWAPIPLSVGLKGALNSREGDSTTTFEEVVENNDVIGLYFSASWCGPCRRVTPILTQAYEKLRSEGKKLQIILVSSDREDTAAREYYSHMPWLMLPFADQKRKQLASSTFKVSGIPTLVLLDKNLKTISTNGVQLLEEEGDSFPWGQKIVQKLTNGNVEEVLEGYALVAILNKDKQEEQLATLTAAAEAFTAERKGGEENALQFVYLVAPAADRLTVSIAGFAKHPPPTYFILSASTRVLPNKPEDAEDDAAAFPFTKEAILAFASGFAADPTKFTETSLRDA